MGAGTTPRSDGSDAPLVVVGWDQAVADHPVAREVLDAMGGGARGGAIRKQLLAAPYGWPQDAVDAALVALHGIGHLTATRNGRPLKTAQLDQTAINTTEFCPEKVRLTRAQLVAIRSLFSKADVRARGGEEGALAAKFLAALHKLASEAGGSAPLPAVPAPVWLDQLGPLTGNEQLLAIYEARDDIEASIAAWERLAERARKRSPVWELATALSRHVVGELDVAEAAAAHLDGDATWSRLDETAREEIRRDVGLTLPQPLQVQTTDALSKALDARSLSAWQSGIDAVPGRAGKAMTEAVRHLPPDDPPVTTVAVRRGTLDDETAVQDWLAEHQRKLTEAVRNGPVIVR